MRIRTKADGGGGTLIPLELNSAQAYLHELLEIQKAQTGFVRAIILKGRQQGCSTYVQARYFHILTHKRGIRAFILTHEDEATRNIFEIADRFYQNLPQLVRPQLGKSNADELSFRRLDSGYRVGTARTKDTGRSGTIQLFHGSEVAFWPNADTHFTGVMESIAEDAGTEIILESTNRGAGVFKRKWEEAVAGVNGFQPIFIPWFWQREYRRATEGFRPTQEELNLAKRFNLDMAQVAWRRRKITNLGGIHKFRQEYPSTPAEAFMTEVPGALWTRKLLDTFRVMRVPPLRRMAIAIDPSTTDKETSDEAGIIWGGIGLDGHVYVMGDESQVSRPSVWAQAAVDVFTENQMEVMIYETNQGGQMVEDLIAVVGRDIPIIGIHASRGKRARAEPVAALYSRGFVHHVGELPSLEDELCGWDSFNSNKSPNRLDALVYLVSYLKLGVNHSDLQVTDVLAM